MRDFGQAEGKVQRVCGGRDVVDIAGLTGDVQLCRVVGQGGRNAHGVTSSTVVAPPWVARKYRDSMFSAAANR